MSWIAVTGLILAMVGAVLIGFTHQALEEGRHIAKTWLGTSAILCLALSISCVLLEFQGR